MENGKRKIWILKFSILYFPFAFYLRRGARVVELDSLENCCALTGTVGSNPTLSAIRYLFYGKVQERLNWQHWKCCEPQKGSVGSNPTLSATKN